MSNLIKQAGSTDVSVVIRIVDSTDGTPETGVVYNTSGIDLWYRREGAVSTDITEADLSTPALTDAHADGGFLHINDGCYRLDLPDAACAAGAAGVQIGGTVTGMVVLAPYIQLDLETADDVANKCGNLVSTTIATLASQTSFTLTAGSADDDAYNGAIAIIVDQTTATQKAVGTVSDYTGSTKTVILSADPGIFTMATGDTIYILAALGSAGSAPTAGQVADAVWDEARADHTSAGTFGQGAASVQGNITGSVASVTGAVGSVTGNVGGNVAGSVASVTGAVGSVTGAVGSVTGNVGGNVAGSVASVTAGVTLADDAITAAKYDETTAFPVASADSGATEIARTGADADTLETLSDQIDGVPTTAEFEARTIAAADYFDPAADAVATVTDVTNLHANAATAAKLLAYIQLLVRSDAAIETDNSTELTEINADGGSGAGNFSAQTDSVEALRDRGDSAWTTGAGGSAPTVEEIRAEMDSNSSQLAAIVEDTNDLQTNQGNWLTATGFSTHSAADVRTEMDSNSTQLAAIVADTNELQTDDLPGLIAALNDPTAAQNAAAVLASQVEAQGTYTLQQALSIILSVCAGVTDTNGSVFKTPNGVANRVSATINASQERTAMTLTPSA